MGDTNKYREGQIVLARVGDSRPRGTIIEVCWSEDRNRYEYVLDCDRWVTEAQITKVIGVEFE